MIMKEELKEKIDTLREHLEGDIGGSAMDLVNKLVELEIELEGLCNR